MLYRKVKDLIFPAVGMGTFKTFDVNTSDPEVLGIRADIINECRIHQMTLVDS